MDATDWLKHSAGLCVDQLNPQPKAASPECQLPADSVEKVGVVQARSRKAENRTIDVSLRKNWGSSVPEFGSDFNVRSLLSRAKIKVGLFQQNWPKADMA
ncbi:MULTISPECIES: hypothetical protein [unclassified Pseudomonas]|uniref:hypothetical protein n=1 Tax=unclassified Pseudomonas TaxID=196821 RepID=UPI00129E30E1|nr:MULTISPECIES: hypothetical protein [unclassified Pseudomonas]MDH4655441.1 hypothetical protein [Pseudomonas sp. BN606]MRK20056.1 hypothetical protein [Pseudomonas sp. JG-B]